jgi:hypothetical protein
LFAVTANHVIQKVFDRRNSGEPVGVFLSDVSIPIPDRLHWHDSEADLALLSVTEGEAAQIGTWIYEGAGLDHVPPEGTHVLSVGFPVYLRTGSDSTDVEYGAASALLQVTSSSDRHFCCRFEREDWIATHGEIPPPGTQFGGLSGGPVFLVGRLHFPMVGIITDFHDAFDSLDVLRVQSILDLPALE